MRWLGSGALATWNCGSVQKGLNGVRRDWTPGEDSWHLPYSGIHDEREGLKKAWYCDGSSRYSTKP